MDYRKISSRISGDVIPAEPMFISRTINYIISKCPERTRKVMRSILGNLRLYPDAIDDIGWCSIISEAVEYLTSSPVYVPECDPAIEALRSIYLIGQSSYNRGSMSGSTNIIPDLTVEIPDTTLHSKTGQIVDDIQRLTKKTYDRLNAQRGRGEHLHPKYLDSDQTDPVHDSGAFRQWQEIYMVPREFRECIADRIEASELCDFVFPDSSIIRDICSIPTSNIMLDYLEKAKALQHRFNEVMSVEVRTLKISAVLATLHTSISEIPSHSDFSDVKFDNWESYLTSEESEAELVGKFRGFDVYRVLRDLGQFSYIFVDGSGTVVGDLDLSDIGIIIDGKPSVQMEWAGVRPSFTGTGLGTMLWDYALTKGPVLSDDYETAEAKRVWSSMIKKGRNVKARHKRSGVMKNVVIKNGDIYVKSDPVYVREDIESLEIPESDKYNLILLG